MVVLPLADRRRREITYRSVDPRCKETELIVCGLRAVDLGSGVEYISRCEVWVGLSD